MKAKAKMMKEMIDKTKIKNAALALAIGISLSMMFLAVLPKNLFIYIAASGTATVEAMYAWLNARERRKNEGTTSEDKTQI